MKLLKILEHPAIIMWIQTCWHSLLMMTTIWETTISWKLEVMISEIMTPMKKDFSIHKNENIFLPCGMITFIPVLNECDIFSTKDYSLKLSPEEFDKYCEQEEKLFGILIKKDSTDYKIGQTDVCNCSITASFKEFRKADGKFYKKIEEIIESKIID